MKEYRVYHNDGVNFHEVFASCSFNDCMRWIRNQVKGMTVVDEDNPCTDDVMKSTKTFCYEVYEMPIVQVIEDEDVYNSPAFQSNYYYL